MAVEVEEQLEAKLLTVHATGKLSRQDYKKFVPQIEQFIGLHGRIRLLFDMREFHGWDLGGFWEDFKFGMHHYNDIERLAIVGETRWQHSMSALCRPFTAATVRFFEQSQIDQARQWLSEV